MDGGPKCLHPVQHNLYSQKRQGHFGQIHVILSWPVAPTWWFKLVQICALPDLLLAFHSNYDAITYLLGDMLSVKFSRETFDRYSYTDTRTMLVVHWKLILRVYADLNIVYWKQTLKNLWLIMLMVNFVLSYTCTIDRFNFTLISILFRAEVRALLCFSVLFNICLLLSVLSLCWQIKLIIIKLDGPAGFLQI